MPISSKSIAEMSFAEIETYQAPENVTGILFEREPYLLNIVEDDKVLPGDDDICIENLKPEDFELPIDFI